MHISSLLVTNVKPNVASLATFAADCSAKQKLGFADGHGFSKALKAVLNQAYPFKKQDLAAQRDLEQIAVSTMKFNVQSLYHIRGAVGDATTPAAGKLRAKIDKRLAPLEKALDRKIETRRYDAVRNVRPTSLPIPAQLPPRVTSATIPAATNPLSTESDLALGRLATTPAASPTPAGKLSEPEMRVIFASEVHIATPIATKQDAPSRFAPPKSTLPFWEGHTFSSQPLKPEAPINA